jgi:two-component system, OmpR family, response regulator
VPEAIQPIMVIDDEERVRELLLEYLSEFEGLELFGAGSAEEALEMLRKHPVKLCVVDLRLPGMDGAEFIEKAAAEHLCGHFIVHTGSVDFLVTQPLKDLGVVQEDVFYKPVDAAEILERIYTHLQDEKPLPEPAIR